MITGVVLLLVLAVSVTQLPVPYVELGPGPTLDTLGPDHAGKDIIQISGTPVRKTNGHLNLTTVSVRDRLDLITAFYGWWDRKRSVVPREDVFPPGKSEQEVQQQNTEQFTESQSSAEYAALGELGYGTRVVVDRVPDDSPSHGKLTGGDVLIKIDGNLVRDSDDVVSVLKEVKPGTTVTVDYTRKGKAARTTVVTIASKQTSGAALGVYLAVERDAPFDVRIGLSDDIGGPSAGLMFALGIIEKVGPEDLTGGRFIAGTGTITSAGVVGPIGGIPLKMIAAKAHGATIFLVPADNCAEAVRKPPKGLQLIKVENLHGAVEALKSTKTGGPAASC
jgi:Lon-like protease